LFVVGEDTLKFCDSMLVLFAVGEDMLKFWSSMLESIVTALDLRSDSLTWFVCRSSSALDSSFETRDSRLDAVDSRFEAEDWLVERAAFVVAREKARFLPGNEKSEVFLNINTKIIAGPSSTNE
jgi:hypothetical protein